MKIGNCSFPEDLLYDAENFIWISNKEKSVTIGITAIMASIAGRLSSIKLKPVGTKLEKGKSCATLESAKYFGVLRTPVSGIIVQVNKSLMNKPKLANDFPYAEGWFVKIELSDMEDLKALETIENCHDKMSIAIQKLRVRCFAAFPDHEMFEIGVECSATLAKLDELIEKIPAGEVIHLVSDDPTADLEMLRWSEERGQSLLEIKNEGNLLHFIVKKMR
ncbi:MAG TPA: sulfurtransferase TusA family protein [Nitrososphaeraceae archaeon]|nr:sulfurtransferase TusA family protein [Nitrososphaeraceae archaeon]